MAEKLNPLRKVNGQASLHDLPLEAPLIY
ncbi:hypothetical protein NSMM_370037 [Nitrosomonas mobilis]|uniref:Uncharacterized protein n=1 Tax=Nitrosomonas mobilis TaxID=51642 RepID=A0A1G5SDS6_9PROT|nr:hypothetical protein NSMM_370037 [Nitrosomonas mobilis]